MKKLTSFFFVAVISIFGSTVASAKSQGILIVGTQAQVREVLRHTKLNPVFSTSEESMVAVRLTKNRMSIYEGTSVTEILEMVGDAAESAVAFTLEAGSKLWELLESLPNETINVGNAALEAACEALEKLQEFVLNGVTFAQESAQEILKAVVAFVKELANNLP